MLKVAPSLPAHDSTSIGVMLSISLFPTRISCPKNILFLLAQNLLLERAPSGVFRRVPRQRARQAGGTQLDSSVGATTYIPRTRHLVQPAARADSLKELCARSALRISAAAGKEIFGWHYCKWMLILLRLRSDSQPEPEFSGFFVHIHTYLVQPKTRDRGIKLFPPGGGGRAAAGGRLPAPGTAATRRREPRGSARVEAARRGQACSASCLHVYDHRLLCAGGCHHALSPHSAAGPRRRGQTDAAC
jgi:hypothetical protein